MELLNFIITAAQDQTIMQKTALKVHSCMVLMNLIITASQDQTIIKKNSTKGSYLYGTDESHHHCGPRSNNHKKTALKVHSCMVLMNLIITAAQDQTIIKKQH